MYVIWIRHYSENFVRLPFSLVFYSVRVDSSSLPILWSCTRFMFPACLQSYTWVKWVWQRGRAPRIGRQRRCHRWCSWSIAHVQFSSLVSLIPLFVRSLFDIKEYFLFYFVVVVLWCRYLRKGRCMQRNIYKYMLGARPHFSNSIFYARTHTHTNAHADNSTAFFTIEIWTHHHQHYQQFSWLSFTFRTANTAFLPTEYYIIYREYIEWAHLLSKPI